MSSHLYHSSMSPYHTEHTAFPILHLEVSYDGFISFQRLYQQNKNWKITEKNRFGLLGQGNGLEFWQMMCLSILDSPLAVFSQQLFGYYGSASEEKPPMGRPL